MKNSLLSHMAVVLMAVLITSPSYAQDNSGDTAAVTSPCLPAPTPFLVVPPTQEVAPFNRVIYVLDVSGSMQDVLPEAIRAVDVFMTDDFQAAVVTFNVNFERWEGVSEPCQHDADTECGRRCLPAGWCRLPLHRPELMGYLRSLVGKGDTKPAGAVEYAIRQAPADCLVVFISDGNYTSWMVRQAAERGMRARKELGQVPTQILVWSTDSNATPRQPLVDLARIGGGGLWRAETPADRRSSTGEGR